MARARVPGVAAIVLLVALAIPDPAAAGAGDPPNWTPQLSLSYVDPDTGERHECGEGCRRFEVPEGIDLEIHVQLSNVGDDQADDPVCWDLWFDQPRSPLPPEDPATCFDDQRRLDTDCWRAMMDRVDHERWDALRADRVCLPEQTGECLDETITVPLDADFEGSRGRGVYALLVWVDRLDVVTESDEFDNVAGPMRVSVVPGAPVETVAPPTSLSTESGWGTLPADASGPPDRSAVFTPTSPMAYAARVLPAHAEQSFTVSSRAANASVEFVSSYPGTVTVEIEQVGVWEKMIVQIRKVSTGEILLEASGKGRMRLEVEISRAQLVDDRRFEVLVLPDQGTRGLRGTISISYPDRALYIRNN